jgi:L-threonylcarbamoyladenylate synthase
MGTKVLKITRHMPEWESIKIAVDTLERGGIICFPTDTIYGFAASIYSRAAIERLRDIKGRGEGPFVVIASDMDIVSELTSKISVRQQKLIDAHWPGPLTIVFEASERVPEYITGPGGSLAVRIPNDVLTQSILRACGLPLAAPSANPKGRAPALSSEEVLAGFEGSVDLLLDGGQIQCPQPSTIVAVKPHRLKILRRGRVPLEKV